MYLIGDKPTAAVSFTVTRKWLTAIDVTSIINVIKLVSLSKLNCD